MRWDLRKGIGSNTNTRIITRFLWFPESCDKDHTHWLEKIHIHQHWRSRATGWVDDPERYRCPDAVKQ
jgi:hypothetical protein